jgi:hypothetical protein
MMRYYEGEQPLIKLIEKPGKSPLGTSLYYVIGTGRLPCFTKQILMVRRCTKKRKIK